jgi:hypothetical protein
MNQTPTKFRRKNYIEDQLEVISNGKFTSFIRLVYQVTAKTKKN